MKDKIVLINPPTTDPFEPCIYFPMALVSLGGVLKKYNFPTELWDFDLYFKKIKNTTETKLKLLLKHGIKGTRANIFGISSICSNYPMAVWMAREIKEILPNSLIIFGGPQPSSVPQETLKRFPCVDLIVCGEGEDTLEEMIKNKFDREKIIELPGVAFRKNNNIEINPKRPLVNNMDDFPYPDYSLINLNEYKKYQQGVSFYPGIEVGRGCPFHCTFCSTSIMWERNFRVKSPERILGEMEALYQTYGFSRFDFIHDNFTTSRKFVEEFCNYMIENNAKSLTWSSTSRTDCIDINRLEKMHEAGCRGLFFGVESGSKEIQRTMKKNLKLEKFDPILKRASEIGVDATTAFIIGFPEETENDLDDTVMKALQYYSLGASRIFFTKLTALAGTKIFMECKDELTEFSQPSTLSQQRYGIPFIDEIICKYPDLFSSYYHVPHPKFSFEYLCKFSSFANHLIYSCPDHSLNIMECLKIGATELFSKWNEWADRNGIKYFPYEIISESLFREQFFNFLEDEILFDNTPRVKVESLNLQNSYELKVDSL